MRRYGYSPSGEPRLGFEIGAHALPATAATNALDHQADIAKAQEWLGHAKHRDHPHLRSPQDAARGQSDVQSFVLKGARPKNLTRT